MESISQNLLIELFENAIKKEDFKLIIHLLNYFSFKKIKVTHASFLKASLIILRSKTTYEDKICFLKLLNQFLDNKTCIFTYQNMLLLKILNSNNVLTLISDEQHDL